MEGVVSWRSIASFGSQDSCIWIIVVPRFDEL